MGSLAEEDVARVARLARIPLGECELRRMGDQMGALLAEFGELAAFAAGLPDEEPLPCGELRLDDSRLPEPEQVREIRAAAPRVGKDGALLVGRVDA